MPVDRVSDAASIRAELEVLEAEEREISAIRRKMHERIDLGFPTDLLIQQEQKLSKGRRELHGRIDALRAQLELLERGE
jgi:anti-sigma-K factor RsiG